jgi:hypothetical protein
MFSGPGVWLSITIHHLSSQALLPTRRTAPSCPDQQRSGFAL